MPIYEFICLDCKESFEKLSPTSQRDKADCKHCGSTKTARKISLTAPAQVKSGVGASVSEGCGAPSCCGGGCGLPN